MPSNIAEQKPASSMSSAKSSPVTSMALTGDEHINSVKAVGSKILGKKPPDGGWGWMVALGMALTFISTTAHYSSFSLLFEGILNKLDAKTTGATLIMSFLTTTVNCTGLATKSLMKSMTSRMVASIGGLLFTAGVSITAFSENIIQIIITYSIVAGIGLGLLSPASYIAFNSYFGERLNLAMGLCQCLIAFGFIIGPPFVQYIMEQYGFRGTMLILGGVGLNSVVGAALFQPVRWHMREVLINRREQGDGMEEVPLGTLETSSNSCSIAVVDASTLNMAVVPDEEDELTTEQATDIHNYKANEDLNQINSQDMECDEHMVISRRGSLVMSTLMDYHSRLKRYPLEDERDGLIYSSTTEILQDDSQSNKASLCQHPTLVALANFGSNVILFDSSLNILQSSQKDPLLSVMQRRKRQMSKHLDNHTHQWSLLEQIPDDEVDEASPVPLIEPKKKVLPSVLCRSRQAISDFFDLSLFADSVFINIVMGLAVSFVCNTNFFTVYPFYLFSLGFTGNDIALFMSVAAGADVIARFILPWVAQLVHLSPRAVYLMACFTSAIARSYVAFIEKSFMPLVIISGIVGFLHGAMVANLSVIISKYCNLERFGAAYSLYMVINGVLSLTVGPLIGVLRDSTDSFTLCIHILSAMLMMCAIAWIVEYLTLWHQSRNVKLSKLTNSVPMCYR